MSVDIHGTSVVGRQRSENQDEIYYEEVGDDAAVVVLADGMGGTAGGATASTVAVETFSRHIADGDWDTDPEATVRSAVAAAHTAVKQEASADPAVSNMGCTLVGGVLLDNTAVLANVGDSRAYDISEEVVQLTTDQTVANELVEEGKLTPAEAEDHQMAHVLQQSIGPTDELEPEIVREQFNDRLLICSDGLTNELDDGQLAELGQRDALSTACEELIGAANDAGGRDNISVVVCSVND